MSIVIVLIKIIFSIVVGICVYKNFETQDTSSLQLIYNTHLSVNKIFSPKQLGSIEISFKKLKIPYNTISVSMLLGIGMICSIFCFIISRKLFSLVSVSLIVSLPMFFSPMWIINFIADKEQNKLERELNDFFIQLKSSLNINSDIIDALRRIQNTVLEPFKSYIKQLLNEINTGKLPENALSSFAQKVNIKKFSMYINNVRYCHIYGGDISELTQKTQKVISDSIKQKRKREKETRSICTVLYMLILIDLYMYFSFVNGNLEYLNIMTNSFLGKCILNVNFISLWGVIWLSRVVRKMDY